MKKLTFGFLVALTFTALSVAMAVATFASYSV